MLANSGSASGELPQVPSILDDDAWQEPATGTQAARAVTVVHLVYDQPISDDRAAMFTRMIAKRGYTAAELAYAAQQMPFDEEVNDKVRYGRPIMPADFEQCIRKVRRTRSMLRRPISQSQVDELCDEWPETLTPDAFGCCGYDDYNNPLYRYVVPEKRAAHRPPPTPVLDDKPRPRRKRDESGGGPMGLGEILGEAQKHTEAK